MPDEAHLHPNWKADDHLIAALARNAEAHPRAVAMRERDHGIWNEVTWADYLSRVLDMAAGLETAGVRPGEVVLVVGDNRPQLYFAMLAVICLRAIPSPAYPDAPQAEILGQMRREDIRAALAEDQEQVDKLLPLRREHPDLALIVYDDPRGLGGMEDRGVVALTGLAAKGRARLAAEPGLAEDLKSRASVHDVAALLHSSGTTGAPKGIPLKHGHVLAGVRNASAAGYFEQDEAHMAYLPMAWVGDFIFSVAAALELRFVVHVPERQETAQHDLREIAPTLYFASPRAWSAMLTRIQVGIAETGGLKRALYEHFMPFAIRLERGRLEGRKPGAAARFWRGVGDALVYAPLRDQLGLRRVRRPYTAGEAIGEDVFLFFRALGLNLRQFYGQTENCALAVAQKPEDISLTSVGRPFPGVEVKIDDKGEILLKGDNNFDGYFRNAEATAETFRDGWLLTGDAGRWGEDGQLMVLGRVSEMVETAQGARFIPTYIENRLKFSPHIRDACVIGAGRDFLTAIVCIDFASVGQWAQENGVAYASYADLAQAPGVVRMIECEIEALNAQLPEGPRLWRFVNLHKEFDPDDGEVTRTRKLRRGMIDETYAPIIDALYDGRESVDFEARITYETGQQGTMTRTLSIVTLDAGKGAG